MIKKITTAVLSIALFFSFITPGICMAVSNPYYYHDCTWTAWQYAHDVLGITLPSWGYADDWCDLAAGDGFSTGNVPAANAVMVWKGHVGFITQVSADGQSVYIVEGGWGDGDNWYHEGWYAANGPSTSGKAFIGYVYLADVPADTTPVGSSEVSRGGTGSSAQRESDLAQLRIKKANLNSQIEETEKKITVLEEQLDQTNRENGNRVRAMYMMGNDPYYEILFSAESISDFFVKVEQVSNIIAMDREMVQKIKSTSNELSVKKTELEQALAELEEIHI